MEREITVTRDRSIVIDDVCRRTVIFGNDDPHVGVSFLAQGLGELWAPTVVVRRCFLAITLTLAGCAMQVETPKEPPPTNYRQIVAEYIRTSFFDPYSVRDAGIAPPRPGWGFGGNSYGAYKTGWAICVRANAKNRMGAYGGSKETIYIVQDGRVVASGQDLKTSDAGSGCEGAQYEPFPEIEEPARRR